MRQVFALGHADMLDKKYRFSLLNDRLLGICIQFEENNGRLHKYVGLLLPNYDIRIL